MDDLTAEWLTCALGRDVADVRRQQIGTGQIADSVRLTLTESDGTQTSLVAKVTSAVEASRRAALMTRTYEKEVGFYADLASSLPVRTPECFWTGFDQDEAAYCVLLEDLAPAEQGDQMRGCTPDDAGKAVDELALLHGPTWNATNLDGRSWLDRGSGTTDPASGSLVEMLLPGFLERYETRLPADVVELAQRVVPKLPKAQPTPNAPAALIHGDFRNDNLMFGGTDGRVCVLDWQTPGIGHPVSDLSYFLGGSLLVDERRGARARPPRPLPPGPRGPRCRARRGRLLDGLPPLRLQRPQHGDHRLDARRPHRPRRRHVHGDGRARRPPRPRPRLGRPDLAMPKLTAMDELFLHQIPEPLPNVVTHHQHWRESLFFIVHPRDELGDCIILTMATFPAREEMDALQLGHIGTTPTIGRHAVPLRR